MRRLPPGLLTWIVLLLALMGVIGFELRELRSQLGMPVPIDSAGPTAPSPDGRLPIAASDLTAQRVAIILARPLFSPDRRPVEPSGDADPTLARLTGVMVAEGGKRAIFASSANGRPIVVGQGERVGRYTVAAIDEGGVTIVGPDGRRVLHPTFAPLAPAVKDANRMSATGATKPPPGAR